MEAGNAVPPTEIICPKCQRLRPVEKMTQRRINQTPVMGGTIETWEREVTINCPKDGEYKEITKVGPFVRRSDE